MAFADGNIIIGTSVDVGGLNTGLKKIEKSFGKIGRLASLVLGVGAFVKLGKAALNAASDLQEVQNVVDVAFGKGTTHDMTGKIERFAETCVQDFGMSRFAAKQTAGSFMAMGKSMGLTMEEASDMSVALTGLTGDMASFLNISQDYARVALSAVYTGETETLKRYGIVLTEANLQQYALSKGIDQNVKKMDARNKAILRYQYIMEKTQYMVGDFQATQNSWANSTRVLSELWKEFLIVLGSGLVSVLSPLVQVLGKIVAKLTQFMTTLWQILSNIFGFKLQDLTDQSREIADNIGTGADAMDDFGDAVDKAGKKAHRQLATFDELNNLTTATASGASGSGGGGLGDIGFGDSSLWDPSNKNAPWADIDNLRDLGKWIGDKICKMLESIDWDKVYQGAKNFGKGLADFLNGLFVDTDLFKDVGHTIAGALNTAIYAALAFGQTLEWGNLGKKLAEGINEFFYTFDFASFAEAINVWVQGLWEFIKETLTNIDWKAVFKGVKDFFSNLDPETVALIMGFLILKKLISLALGKALISGILEGMGLSGGLSGLVSGLGKKIGAALISKSFWLAIGRGLKSAFVAAFKWVTTSLPTLISDFVADLSAGISTFLYNMSLGNSLNASLTYAFGSVATTIMGILSILGGLILAVKEFVDMWKKGWSVIKTILEAIGLALAAVGAVILGVSAWWAALIAAIIFVITQLVIVIHDNWDAIKAWFISVGEWFKENVIDPIVSFVKEAWSVIKAIVTPIINFFKGLFLRIGQFAEGCWIIIKAIWIVASEWFKDNVIDPICDFFKAVWATVSGFFKKLWQDIKTVWNAVASWFNSNVIQPIVNFFAPIVAKIAGYFTQVWNTIKSVWSTVANWFKTTVINPIVNAWNIAINAIKGFFTSLWNSIISGVKAAINSFIGAVQNGINGIINKINSVIQGFNKVVGWAANVTGDNWGGVSLIPNISIPRLARGGVIPPNNEFMAILGDQKSGTNVEAPLDTIKQALAETLAELGGASGNEDIVINIDGTEIFRVVRKQATIYNKSTGLPAF